MDAARAGRSADADVTRVERGTLSSKKGRAWITSVGHEAEVPQAGLGSMLRVKEGARKGFGGWFKGGVGVVRPARGDGGCWSDPILVKWRKRKLLKQNKKIFFPFLINLTIKS